MMKINGTTERRVTRFAAIFYWLHGIIMLFVKQDYLLFIKASSSVNNFFRTSFI